MGPSRGAVAAAFLGLAGAGLLGLAWSVFPFFCDDAPISLRYAERLASGQGLTWTDGDRTEGYSDLLWVLLQVPGFWLRVEPVLWARLVGLLGSLVALVTVGLGPDRRLSPARAATALLLATSLPFATWAIAGLEHSFLCGLLGVVLVALRRLDADDKDRAAWRLAVLGMGLVTLTRADGAVLVAGTALGLVLASRASPGQALGRGLRLVVAPLLVFLVQTLSRRAWSGAWVPNTAVAKVALNADRTEGGFRWVLDGLSTSWVVGVAAAAALSVLVARGRHRPALVPVAMAGTWFLYVGLVGGDIFPAFRQLVPGVLPLTFLAAEGAEAFLTWRPRAWPALSVALALAVAAQVLEQRRHPENHRAVTERWEWAGEPMGELLRVAFGARRPLLAVDAAGALPFWSKLPALDMLGLNDSWLARHPPPGFGHGGIGHELGNGDYVLGRAPDLVAFCNAQGAARPCFVGGREMLADPRFARDYRLVRYEAEGVVGEIWTRFASGPLAAVETHAGLELPAWYLASTGPATATLADDARLEVLLDEARAGAVELELGPGVWRTRLEPEGLVSVSWRCGGRTASQPGTSEALSLDRPTRVTLELRARAPLRARRLWVERGDAQAGWSCDGAAELSAAAIAEPHPEHTAWDAPGVAVLRTGGLLVRLGSALQAEALELSADNNDTYLLEFLRDGAAVASTEVPPRLNGGGLAIHRVSVPEAALGASAIRVSGRGGDGAYSVGHLRAVK